MNATDINKKSDMPPYLVVDSQALCRHLSLIRSLAKSREFIIIVPIQGLFPFGSSYTAEKMYTFDFYLIRLGPATQAQVGSNPLQRVISSPG